VSRVNLKILIRVITLVNRVEVENPLYKQIDTSDSKKSIK